jgi:two-component system, LuxR family, response regulator FixJ
MMCFKIPCERNDERGRSFSKKLTIELQLVRWEGGSKVMVSFPAYVVEDEELSRTLLARQLSNLGRDFVMFEHATAFFRRINSLEPGIIVLDLRLPGMSGLDLLDQLDQMEAMSARFGVVVHSASNEVTDAISAFRHGVIDFLRKPSASDELARVLAEGDAYLDAQIEAAHRQSVAKSIKLTAREREILLALAAGKQSKVIAFDLDISVRTVEMHRSSVINKLSARSASHALAKAKELGLI